MPLLAFNRKDRPAESIGRIALSIADFANPLENASAVAVS
jgi:hypothetical protein